MVDMKEAISKLIEANSEIFENAFLKRFPTDEELSKAESILGLKLPEEYVWFLKTYGHGGFFFEFLGYGLNGAALFANKTLKEREAGLPQELLVIEDCDEFVECIDTISGEIVSWSRFDKAGIVKIADNFYEHFVDKLENAIDNWE